MIIGLLQRCPSCTAHLSSDGTVVWCSRCAYEPAVSQALDTDIPIDDIREIEAEVAYEAEAERHAARRAQFARRKARGVSVHGRRWSYTLGCRCDDCQAAYEASKGVPA